MIIQVNTDNHIHGTEGLAAEVEATVESSLDHLHDRVTRVEVHLSDENGPKGGDRDIRCVMEARLKGQQPTAVSHAAGLVSEAVDGAAEKLRRALESIVGRQSDRQPPREP